MCQHFERELPCELGSVGLGRRFVSGVLDARGALDLRVRDDVLLVTSELLTNAVKFGSEMLTLSVSIRETYIRIAIADNNPELAVVQRPSPDAFGGRGLAMVTAIALAWGQTAFDGLRKTVWCQMQLSLTFDPPAECMEADTQAGI